MKRLDLLKLGIVFSIALFLYLMASEVRTRVQDRVEAFLEYRRRVEESESTGIFESRIKQLERERTTLSATLRRGMKSYEPTQTGVIEFLNSKAQQCSVQVESIVPGSPRAAGQVMEIPYRITMSSAYHPLGNFVNKIETEVFRTRIARLEITSADNHKGHLKADIEGMSSVVTSLTK
jgi:Tfp pilus assembly protein PilO